MSEHLTHIAVYEDCARMILNTDKFCEAFRKCIENEYDSGMIASGSRGNHLWAVPILEKHKTAWKNGEQTEVIQQQIAGAIGWLTHRASDHQMKPLWRGMKEKDPTFNDTEMQIYHDAVTVREVYDSGKLTTESPFEHITQETLEEGLVSHPASKTLKISTFETLLTFMWQREFVELHQFIANKEDPAAWVDNLIEYHQGYTEDLRTYIEAFQNPDPDKMELYIHSVNHYNPEDEIIEFVRGIQRNKPVDHIDLEEAVELAENQSQYAQALRKGYLYVSAASDYFDDKLEKDKLYDVLVIAEHNRF